MCELWIKMNQIELELTEKLKYKTTTGQNSSFLHSAHGTHTILKSKSNTHNCEWDRDRMSGFGAHTGGNTRTDRYFVLQWTEIDENWKNHCTISLRLCHSHSHTHSATYALTSVSLCVRSRCSGVLVCWYDFVRLCTHRHMVLCVHEWLTDRERTESTLFAHEKSMCSLMCACIRVYDTTVDIIGVRCSRCVRVSMRKWNTLTFHCRLYAQAKSLRGHNVI